MTRLPTPNMPMIGGAANRIGREEFRKQQVKEGLLRSEDQRRWVETQERARTNQQKTNLTLMDMGLRERARQQDMQAEQQAIESEWQQQAGEEIRGQVDAIQQLGTDDFNEEGWNLQRRMIGELQAIQRHRPNMSQAAYNQTSAEWLKNYEESGINNYRKEQLTNDQEFEQGKVEVPGYGIFTKSIRNGETDWKLHPAKDTGTEGGGFNPKRVTDMNTKMRKEHEDRVRNFESDLDMDDNPVHDDPGEFNPDSIIEAMLAEDELIAKAQQAFAKRDAGGQQAGEVPATPDQPFDMSSPDQPFDIDVDQNDGIVDMFDRNRPRQDIPEQIPGARDGFPTAPPLVGSDYKGQDTPRWQYADGQGPPTPEQEAELREEIDAAKVQQATQRQPTAAQKEAALAYEVPSGNSSGENVRHWSAPMVMPAPRGANLHGVRATRRVGTPGMWKTDYKDINTGAGYPPHERPLALKHRKQPPQGFYIVGKDGQPYFFQGVGEGDSYKKVSPYEVHPHSWPLVPENKEKMVVEHIYRSPLNGKLAKFLGIAKDGTPFFETVEYE